MSANAEQGGMVDDMDGAADRLGDYLVREQSVYLSHKSLRSALQAALAQNAQGHGDAVAFLVTDAKGKKFTIYNALLAEAIRKIAKDKGSSLQVDAVCTIPDYGWFCTRGEGHDGPCAAWPNSPTETCPTCGGPATRREVSGAFEMRNEWSHAEHVRVPAEFFTDLRRAKSAADRSQKINRLHVYGRVVERHIESLLASSATNADVTGATP